MTELVGEYLVTGRRARLVGPLAEEHVGADREGLRLQRGAQLIGLGPGMDPYTPEIAARLPLDSTLHVRRQRLPRARRTDP